jgi:hypothetical protein
MDEENQESMKLGIHKGGPQKLKSSGVRRYVCVRRRMKVQQPRQQSFIFE